MKVKRIASLVSVLGLVSLLGVGSWVLLSSRLYSDPSQPRESEAYEKAHNAITNFSQPDTNTFFALTVFTNSGQVVIQFPKGLEEKQEYRHPFFFAEGSNSVRVGESQLTLRSIGVTHLHDTARGGTARDRGVKYFAPSGQVQDPEQIEDVIGPWRGNLRFRGEFPRVSFFFQCTNLPSSEIRVLKFEAFDRRTRRPLNSGYSSSAPSHGTPTIWISADLELWHQTPVELVLTIATGPVQIESHPVEVDVPPISFPGGSLKLIHIADTPINGWGSDTSGATNFVRLTQDSNLKEQASLVFHVWPAAQGIPIQIQLMDREGKPVVNAGMQSSDNLLIASAKGTPEQLGAFQVLYYPNIYRLIFHLPELPGLPEENRSLGNLFDIHIPYVRFPSENQFQGFISRLTAMKGSHIPLTYPNGYFPLVSSNTTVRELFREMESLASDPGRFIVVDPVKNEIRYEPSALHTLLQKTRQRLGW